MFGFLGLADFGHTINLEKYFLLLFHIFGFFSFFFEGKLSHILEDELFQENKRKAQLEAYKIGFKTTICSYLAYGNRCMFSRNVEWCNIYADFCFTYLCSCSFS